MTEEEDPSTIRVVPWPGESLRFALVLLLSLMIWLMLAVSIFGLVYVAFIGLFLFFSHLALVTHIRGSGVKLGPEQFPELHRRVEELSARLGMPAPDAYLMQQGGALNAFAIKLFRSKMIVLYSDLLEACGDDEASRDMVIGHELGHIRAGHLTWLWVLTPGMFVPFVGAAYSRARERTCDRYGLALCGEPDGALRGLAILAAGGKHGPEVNLEAMVDQRQDLAGGWMTLGRWLSFYPTLAERIAALEPRLGQRPAGDARGPVLACGVLALLIALPIAGMAVFFGTMAASFREALDEARDSALDAADLDTAGPMGAGDVSAAKSEAASDAELLATGVRRYLEERGELPSDLDDVYEAWPDWYGGAQAPVDPFDGLRYGYELRESGFSIWSSGPDGEPETDDDLVFEFAG